MIQNQTVTQFEKDSQSPSPLHPILELTSFLIKTPKLLQVSVIIIIIIIIIYY